MAGITFKNVVKTYDNGVTVIPDLNMEIKDKEFVVLVGPSGCGKSTTLRMIAGLEGITEGDMYIGDTRMNAVAPKDRDIAMVFQNYALYPHMSVYKNMAFALTMKSTARSMRRRRSWDWRNIWTVSRRLSPADSVSVWLWAGPWSVIRPSSCWTNLCPTWTPS